MTSFAVTPIGRIRTPFRTIEDCPRMVAAAAEPCRIDLLPAFADALFGIGAASHLWLLYWLDQADRFRLTVATPHDGVVRGVFANRSPARPNPIAMRAVRLYAVEPRGPQPSLLIGGMDCLDGTPLLDLKPYVPPSDRIDDATLEWLSA
jgi:tRNA-Thr(GGU) m(6)t(6)A37 methyltransferase TsaA